MTAPGVGGTAARKIKLAAFPPEAAFLPALAAAWLMGPEDPADGLIILPNRRAARALAGAFLTANGGRALLLPRIIAPGAIDEAGLALTGALDLPPAITPISRQAILTTLILKLNGRDGAPQKLPQAWALAADLGALLDEADEAEIDLAAALTGIVPAALAEHWQTTLQFLEIVTNAWPAVLAAQGVINPVSRRNRLLDAQTAAWAAKPPPYRVWLVARDAGPAAARLARTVAGLPAGQVILPGYDAALPDSGWDALEDSHAQSGIRDLLAAMGAIRGDVTPWPAPAAAPGRAALLSRALLPAAALADWQSTVQLATKNLFRLAAQDEAQDATAIAMALRGALETPGTTTALITPDRGLAVRVAAALRRFGITADDSAGENLADTPPALFLRLLAAATASDYAPLPLLALLKHPLTAAGEPPEICRDHARKLELAALRGPRPAPGFDGIKFRLHAQGKPADRDFLARLEVRLAAITGLPAALNPAAALRLLITAGEALATTDQQAGAARLWAGEAGAGLSEVLLEALAALETLPDMPPKDIPELLDALLAGHVIRRPRTKDGHPRVAIWGVQEAALQAVDFAVLAGLNESVWPAAAVPGPWLSRAMRTSAGLPSPEAAIGRAAHDFFSLSCACKTVILSAPVRRARAPAVPARWLTRLDAMLAGAGLALPAHEAATWAAQLDSPVARTLRPKPKPCPPAERRPRELSISDIATLMADPYAVYARKILNIRKLDDLDAETDASLFGNIVHAGLEEFYKQDQDFTAPDAARELTTALQNAMRKERPREALQAWWAAQLARIATWIVETEQARRTVNPPVHTALEIPAKLAISGGFTLNGRADRIEKRADGTVFIADYKTGRLPKDDEVAAGAKPQLPFEAVMAEAGAFGEAFRADVTELAFWKISGRAAPGEEKRLYGKKPNELRAVIDAAAEALPKIFARFADPATPYLAQPHPGRSTFDDPYAGISRRAEWGGEGDDDGD